MRVPSIFETNNARDFSAQRVAETFIPPPVFAKLCKSKDSLVVGPRGSGKTTLLKMLQPSALRFWDNPRAAEISGHIEFSGVYVQADVIFSQELAFYKDVFDKNGELIRE